VLLDSRPIAIFLTPVWPAPGGSGRALRAWDWLCTLSQTHRVHMLVDASATPESDSGDPNAEALTEAIWRVPRQITSFSRIQRVLALLFPPWCLIDRRLTVDWAQWNLEPVLPRLQQQLAGEGVARVVVFRFYLHDIAKEISRAFPEASLELDMDDLESSTRWSVAGALLRLGRPIDVMGAACSAMQYALLERFLPGSYENLWLASRDDCDRLRTRLSARCAARPNRVRPLPELPTVESSDAELSPSTVKPLRLLFVGTLNYPPNEEAVRILAHKLVPLLRQRLRVPWRLCVVGRHASAELVASLQRTAEIEFVPDAPQMRPWYKAAEIVLVPMRAGGGTQFKSIEALSYGRAVIATPQGMRGLGAVPDQHYLSANTPLEFALAIERLIAEPAFRERLGRAGRALMP
jgi:glycosyltransferase involved in cell wall biosynthesis